MKKGSFVLSNTPRIRPMMMVLEISDTCVTDLFGARCDATIFETGYGFDIHTNSTDNIAEAIGEYGLTPDDVHDSFNMWMNTVWDDVGPYKTQRNTGKKGDHIDLMAVMDVLAVPEVCGGGDLSWLSNFFFKPIQIQVFQHSDGTESIVEDVLRKHTGLKNQRTVESFHVKEIRTERELRPTPGYQPRFPNHPLKVTEVEVELAEDDARNVQVLRRRWSSDSDEEVVRAACLQWYTRHRGRRASIPTRW